MNFDKVKNSTGKMLNKFVEEVKQISNVSKLKLKIAHYKFNINKVKKEIGEFVIENKEKFEENPQIKDYLSEISCIKEKIKILEEKIAGQKEKK